MEEQPLDYQMPAASVFSSETMERFISREALVQQLLDSLNGVMKDKNGKEIYKGKPLLLPAGIDRMLQIYISILNHNVLLSNLTENEINVLTQMAGEAVDGELFMNHKNWGLQDVAQMDTVSVIMILNIRAVLKSAESGFLLDHLTGMFKRTESNEKSQFGGFHLPWFGGGGNKSEIG